MSFVLRGLALSVFCLTIVFASCKHTDETNISAHNDTESHNMGKNCMHCHKVGGDGKGWFTAAGTVYDSIGNSRISNGTIRLWTSLDANRILRATIDVDGNGNFFTTENIDYTTGLYPEITGTSGDVRTMTTPIAQGACNSCHDGQGTPRIWVR